MADFGESSFIQHPAGFQTIDSAMVDQYLAMAPPNIPGEQVVGGDPVASPLQTHQPALQLAPHQPAVLTQGIEPNFNHPDSNGVLFMPYTSGGALQPPISPGFNDQMWPGFLPQQAQLSPTLSQGQWQEKVVLAVAKT